MAVRLMVFYYKGVYMSTDLMQLGTSPTIKLCTVQSIIN